MNTITLDYGSTTIREKSPGSLEASTCGGPWWSVPHDGFVLQMFYRLIELSWVPVTERMPTEEDADEHGDVDWSDGKEIWEAHYTEPREATHWRRIVLP